MILFSKALYQSFKLSFTCSNQLANLRTAVVALILTPLFDLGFSLFFGSSMGVSSVSYIAQAVLILSLCLITAAQISVVFCYLRGEGVFQELLLRSQYSTALYLGIALYASFVACLSAGVLCLFNIMLYGWTAPLCLSLLYLSPLALILGTGIGYCAAFASSYLSDPYAVLSWISAVLPLSSGLIVPLKFYPELLGQVCIYLPISQLIDCAQSLSFTQLLEGYPLRDLLYAVVFLVLAFLLCQSLKKSIKKEGMQELI